MCKKAVYEILNSNFVCFTTFAILIPHRGAYPQKHTKMHPTVKKTPFPTHSILIALAGSSVCVCVRSYGQEMNR